MTLNGGGNLKFHRRFQILGCFLRTALYFCPFRCLPIEGTFSPWLSFDLFRRLLLRGSFHFFRKISQKSSQLISRRTFYQGVGFLPFSLATTQREFFVHFSKKSATYSRGLSFVAFRWLPIEKNFFKNCKNHAFSLATYQRGKIIWLIQQKSSQLISGRKFFKSGGFQPFSLPTN